MVFLVSGIIFGFLGLLIAFSNVLLRYPVFILFTPLGSSTPLTIPLLLIMFIGGVSGSFLTLFFVSRKSESGDEDVFE